MWLHATGASDANTMAIELLIDANCVEKLGARSISLIPWPQVEAAFKPSDSTSRATSVVRSWVLRRHNVSSAEAGPHIPTVLTTLRTTVTGTPLRKAKSDSQLNGNPNSHLTRYGRADIAPFCKSMTVFVLRQCQCLMVYIINVIRSSMF